MTIRTVRAELWTLPLRAPFAISQRTAYTAENIFIFVDAGRGDESIVGYGASAPVAYVTGETVESVTADVERIGEALVGFDVDRLQPMLSIIATETPNSPAARAGLEMAIYDAWAKSHGIALWDHFGASAEFVSTDITIPITTAENAAELARTARAAGFSAFKIKVGHCDGADADLRRIQAVVEAARNIDAKHSENVTLRIDANQAFTVDGAIGFARSLDSLAATIELIEQPVARGDVEGLKAVRDAIDYPVFADESACSPENVLDLIRHDAIDGVNVKLMKSGIVGALRIIELCRAAGKRLMIGCMLETTLGIAAAAQIAAGTGAFDHIDLDSHDLLAPIAEVDGGVRARGPMLSVERQAGSAGWGVEVRRIERNAAR